MKVAALGECMLEFSRLGANGDNSNHFKMSYGGDTLNTAAYLNRLGVDTDYVTALGDDPYSQMLIDNWQQEGIGTDLVRRMHNRVPGLYMIETDETGERSFHYWRDNAPVRDLLNDATETDKLFEQLSGYHALYLSGITLSLFQGAAWQPLLDGLAKLKAAGVEIIFDGNYRPKGWPNKTAAQNAFNQVLAIATLCLPTFEDEQDLFGDETPQQTAARMHSAGVAKVVVKQGADGCLTSDGASQSWVAAHKIANVIDTTGAGDSFNGGFLSQYFKGRSLADCAQCGHDLASVVIQHRGAIIDKAYMPN
ncbi:sugar kinase [Paraferrimonas sp. SM1919]|uniref:sugar kinase n=1 Tax=Paraferrimonas sp. SM1919 TaxID=2662263 RepID=UPI0013CF4099|nr:sugar kinase [Paraferrimonas sp. SM1919]